MSCKLGQHNRPLQAATHSLYNLENRFSQFFKILYEVAFLQVDSHQKYFFLSIKPKYTKTSQQTSLANSINTQQTQY
jgi:hypothetical protein